MNATQVRIASLALFFVLIFIFGFWLSRSGKPYNGILFNLHKLISLGAVLFLGLTAAKAHQTAPLDLAQIAALAVTVVCFLSAIVTGGLLSALKDVPAVVMGGALGYPLPGSRFDRRVALSFTHQRQPGDRRTVEAACPSRQFSYNKARGWLSAGNSHVHRRHGGLWERQDHHRDNASRTFEMAVL